MIMDKEIIRERLASRAVNNNLRRLKFFLWNASKIKQPMLFKETVFTCCTEINKVRIFRRNTILDVNSVALMWRVPAFESQVLYQTLGSIIVARGFRRKCLLASIVISIKTR